MKNGMTPLFTFDEMERWFDHFQSKAEDKMLVFLQAGGEKFIEVARRSGSYKDQTGNLRSSIGYIIAKDGEVVTENFKEGDKGTDKTTGKYKGRRLAEEVSLSYTVVMCWSALQEWNMRQPWKLNGMKSFQVRTFNVRNI